MQLKYSGFTLVELLIILLLTSLISVMSLQGMDYLNQHSTDNTLSSKLIKTLQFAKQESLLRHMDIAIHLADQNNQTMIVTTEHNQKLLQLNLHLSGGRLNWQAYPSYQDHITFHASGDKLSDNATIWYCHHNDKSPVWAIKLSRDARVHKVLPNRDGLIIDSHHKALYC